jgi:pimeloyl-ACP methyl ester carboxylesterase
MAKVADIDLELFESGQGSPVLFLHGGEGFDERQPFVAPLAAKHRLIAPSHPGFGKSSLPEWLDSVDDIAHIYLELLDTLGLDKVDVIGCSIGGWIAAEMATREHTRITGVILIDAVGISVDDIDIADFFALNPNELAQRTFHNPSLMPDPATLPADAQQMLKANGAAIAAYAKRPYMHDPKLRRRLRLVQQPVLTLWGESDQIAPPAYGRAYAESFPNARFESIPQAGHLPQIERPDATLAHIRRFAAETGPTV